MTVVVFKLQASSLEFVSGGYNFNKPVCAGCIQIIDNGNLSYFHELSAEQRGVELVGLGQGRGLYMKLKL